MSLAHSKPQRWAPDGTSVDESTPFPTQADVVVVGGGFSGIQAAYDLQQAGLNAIVLEAKHRIAGRSRSHKLKSGPGIVELGATWINKTTQPKVYALSRKLGLETLEQYNQGEMIWETADGAILRCESDSFPEFPGVDQSELFQLIGIMDATAASIDLHAHDEFPKEMDVSVEDWLQSQNVNEHLVQLMRYSVRAVIGQEPRDVGLHYYLDYVKSGCGIASLSSVAEHGAQNLKIKQGTSAIINGLAAQMTQNSIFVNSPVISIVQNGTRCQVTTTNGIEINCSKVIVAIPTNTYEGIKFIPSLPQDKRAIVTRTQPGVYAKALITYKSAWWRDIGLAGSFNSFKGPICFSLETSNAATEQYSLACFIAGDIASEWHKLSKLKREEALLTHLAKLLGDEHAHLAEKDLLEINIVDWTEEDFLWGAPTNAMGPGELVKYGKALRAPLGNIHFAGGETAYEWKGYLEGALLAGSRAAEEAIANEGK